MPDRLVDYTRNVAAYEAEIGEFAVTELRKFPYAPVGLQPITKKPDNLANKHDNTTSIAFACSALGSPHPRPA